MKTSPLTLIWSQLLIFNLFFFKWLLDALISFVPVSVLIVGGYCGSGPCPTDPNDYDPTSKELRTIYQYDHDAEEWFLRTEKLQRYAALLGAVLWEYPNPCP